MKRSLGAVLAVLFMGTAVWADLSKGSQTLAVFGGLAGSRSEYDYQPGTERNVTGGGGAIGAQYLYYVTEGPAFGVGVDLASSLNGNKQEDDLLTGFDSTARLKSFVGMAIARLSYPRGLFRPYLFGGVGLHDSSQQLSAKPQAGTTWTGGGTESRMLVDERKTSAAIGYGVGLDLFLAESFFLGTELRGVWLAGLDTGDTAALRAAGFNEDSGDQIFQGNFFLRAGVKF